MNKTFLFLAAVLLGFAFVQGCGTPETSNKPWDRPQQEDNRPGYKTDGAMPLNRDAR